MGSMGAIRRRQCGGRKSGPHRSWLAWAATTEAEAPYAKDLYGNGSRTSRHRAARRRMNRIAGFSTGAPPRQREVREWLAWCKKQEDRS